MINKQRKEKHWSSSNVFPVFKLSAPQHNQEFVVLEGTSEDTLIFGPGRASQSYFPSDNGTVVIHGNRHFEFLQNINLNDQILLNDQLGTEYQYCVLDVRIIDIEKTEIKIRQTDELLLLTPWPFDGYTKDNTLRYVVSAIKYETYKD